MGSNNNMRPKRGLAPCIMTIILATELLLSLPSISTTSDGGSSNNAHDSCVMGFEVCGQIDGLSGDTLPVPCTYHGRPRQVANTTLLKQLDLLCPSLDVLNNQTELCCDHNQISNFLDGMSQARDMIGSCPSCLINFATLFCLMACSPKQGQFIKVLKQSPYPPTTADTHSSEANYTQIDNDEKFSVDEVEFSISERFVQGLFQSCKNVIYSQAQAPALDLMCGEDCNAHELVEHLGVKGLSPFDIQYRYYDDHHDTDSHTYLDMAPINCNESVASVYPRLQSQYPSPCSAVDCPVGELRPFPEDPATCKIMGLDSIYLMLGMANVLLLLVLTTVYLYSTRFRKINVNVATEAQSNESEPSPDPAPTDKLIDDYLKKIFNKWALICVTNATLVVMVGAIAVVVCSCGLLKLEILTDPVDLWSQPDSRAYQEKVYYEQTFGPFYRIEQVIIYPTDTSEIIPFNGGSAYGEKVFTSVFNRDFLTAVNAFQSALMKIEAKRDNDTVRLADICLQPLNNGLCSIQSPLGWFQDEEANFELVENYTQSYLGHFLECFNNAYNPKDKNYANLSCLAPYKGPIFPHVALAGYPAQEYWQSKGLVITIPIRNYVEPEANVPAKAWEKEFLKFVKQYTNDKLRLAYYSERSIEDEIERQSQSDLATVALSYLVMFAYVALTLGNLPAIQPDSDGCHEPVVSCLIGSRIALGLAGVLIVLASVVSSIGILSMFGIKATLIIMEVIPFLVLAVGVDNIFIVVQALQNSNQKLDEQLRASQEQDKAPYSQLDRHIARVVGEVGPSILLASLSESTCFLIGTLTPMPAVRVFALTAALALIIDFLLQVSVFVALLALDTRRQMAGRLDLLCCLAPPPSKARRHTSEHGQAGPVIYGYKQQVQHANEGQNHFLHRLFRDHLASYMMRPVVRFLAMLVLVTWSCLSLATLHKIEVGLDQTMSVPDDSYILDYFAAQRSDLRVGPPVFFVLRRGLDYHEHEEAMFLCSSTGCYSSSLTAQIAQASKQPNVSYLATTATSWYDDYFLWASSDQCCRAYKDDANRFCPAGEPDLATNCTKCDLLHEDGTQFKPDRFYVFLEDFLADVPTTKCVRGGAATYAQALNITKFANGTLIDAIFSSYHIPLTESSHFIEAMKAAQFVAKNIEDMLNANLRPQPEQAGRSQDKLHVFPYSFPYVFYEQYLTIWQLTVRNIVISLLTILIVSYLLLGCDLFTASVIVATITLIVINMMGLMFWWNIQLNAVSLVNLVMAIGISVEFCSHVARAYAISTRSAPVDRAHESLVKMGSSVLSGVTLTKVAGISILAFAKSKIFKIYYFRMYMGIVLVGATHGLVFMPIAMSLVGRRRPVQRQDKWASHMVVLGHSKYKCQYIGPGGVDNRRL